MSSDLIVLHYTAMASVGAALHRLCDAECEVSAHYLIAESGVIYQLVDEENRAWHAGVGVWGACDDINSASIGIELANDGMTPFAAAQMDQLEGLLAGIMARWSIAPERVIGHSDMAFSRKADPGARFDWRRLWLAGLSVWPEGGAAQSVSKSKFSKVSQAFGYGCSSDDQALLNAVRGRFRPWAAGPLDGVDMALITELASRFPVDRRGAKA